MLPEPLPTIDEAVYLNDLLLRMVRDERARHHQRFVQVLQQHADESRRRHREELEEERRRHREELEEERRRHREEIDRLRAQLDEARERADRLQDEASIRRIVDEEMASLDYGFSLN
jgi:chromosome segregation ATPase